MKLLSSGLFKLTGGITISGRDHIPARGPFILVANHQSLIDPLVLGVCIPRTIIFLAAAYLFELPFIGRIITAGGALPVNHPKGDLGTIKQALANLSTGGAIGVFPEGGVSSDGKLQPFLPGWAFLALKAGVPAIPAAISGTRRVLPVGKYVPRRFPISVVIGKPLFPSTQPRTCRQSINKLSREMAQTIAGLLKSI
ncbi:MAG: 1-acyl-sn-glycerol-3-phosphate acyltransferase [Firmicutes bacterium]|nr:1-acyl-sn-glycerol-3-phosphate acyltransferase [Bacillota bacterium]